MTVPDHVFLLVSQSNTGGRGGGPPYTTANANVKLWNDGSSLWEQLEDPIESEASMFPAMGNQLTTLLGGTVGFIEASVGGTGFHKPVNNAWDDDTDDVYVDSLTLVSNSGATIEGVIAFGGEADIRYGTTTAEIQTAIATMMSNYRRDLNNDNLPFYYYIPWRGDFDSVAVRDGFFNLSGTNLFLVEDTIDYTRDDQVHVVKASLDTLGLAGANRIAMGSDTLGQLNVEGLTFGMFFNSARGMDDQGSGTWPVYAPNGLDQYKGTFEGIGDGYVANNNNGYLQGNGSDRQIDITFQPDTNDSRSFCIEVKLNFVGAGTAEDWVGAFQNSSNMNRCGVFASGNPFFLFEYGNVQRYAQADHVLTAADHTVLFCQIDSEIKIFIDGVEPDYVTQQNYTYSGNNTVAANFHIGGRGDAAVLSNSQIYSATFWHKDISSRALTNHNLGNNYKLKGFDNGDNTMKLLKITNKKQSAAAASGALAI